MQATAQRQFYTVMGHLERRFQGLSRRCAYRARSPLQHRRWRARTHRIMWELLGLQTMVRTDPRPRFLESVEVGGVYVRQKMLLDTEPGVTMPLYVLRPTELRAGERRPAVIATHGHGGGGKESVAGVGDDPAVAAAIRRYDYAYGEALVREGFVVFAPDARGFGERRESTAQADAPEVRLGGSCAQLAKMALPLGQTVVGMWIWDLMRLVDYIETREDCRADRIGCAGFSGGGLQALWLAALDERIAACVVSGYLYGSRESLLVMSGNCMCNYIPHLWEHVDMGDLAALIPPRPLFVETGSRDPLNGASGLANVASQVEIVRRAYRVLGAEGRFAHDVFDGEHRWNGANAVPWLKRWLEA